MSSPRPSTATLALRTNTPDADRVVSLLPSSDPDGVVVPRYFHQVYQYEAAAPPMRRHPQQQGLPSHRYPSDRGPATEYQAARISSRPYEAMPTGPGRFWSAGAHYGSPGYSGTRSRRPRGRCFVTAVSLFMSFEYCAYASAVLPSILYPKPSAWAIIYTLLFHIFFTLAIIAFVQTSVVDPGIVPANWGFYMGDDCKRRRYCKVCHVWKPDRTHHCSACGRCVLNMDHHCPWVSNCIGFENRKFFIQFLCYGLLCVTCLVVHGSYFVITQGSELVPRTSPPADPSEMLGYILNVSRFGTAVIMLLLAIMLEVPLIPFTKFHLTMITRNSTTIENMDSLSRDRARYDLGVMRNLEQVLGPTISLWWLPFHTRASRPVGDGVRWRQQYWKALEGADL